MGPPRTQRLFPPEPILHRRRLEPEAPVCEGVPSSRCKLLLINDRALLESKELYQSHGGQ